MSDPICVFDIETVPDVEGGRKIHGLENLSEQGVAKAMQQKRRQETGSDFLKPHLQRIVAISVVMRFDERCRVWSLGQPDSPESELVRRFFDGIAKYSPILVSWNGDGFDLPVLHYRALVHGIRAPRYWEVGEDDRDFRYDNYLNRFHWRHIDLMDVLAGYQVRAVARLDEIALLLGLPGKMGMDGGKVWQAFQDGEIDVIRNYCETDVLNTYLVYLRFQLMRGQLQPQEYQQECRLLHNTLTSSGIEHLQSFAQAWNLHGA